MLVVKICLCNPSSAKSKHSGLHTTAEVCITQNGVEEVFEPVRWLNPGMNYKKTNSATLQFQARHRKRCWSWLPTGLFSREGMGDCRLKCIP